MKGEVKPWIKPEARSAAAGWPKLAQCLAVLMGIGIAFILAEFFVRLVFPEAAPRTARVTKFWQYHPRYGWAHVPNAKGTFEAHGFSASVSINSRGFRGPLVSYRRVPGLRRAVFLGDSYLWGFGVSDHEVFTALLEASDPGLEAVNLGVSGYSTDQELLLYQEEGYKYNADLIVVMVVENDFASNLRRIEYVAYGKPIFVGTGEKLELQNQPVPKAPLLKRLLVEAGARSYFATMASRILEGIQVRQALAQRVDERETEQSAADDMMYRLLLELNQTVNKKQPGAKLLAVFVEGVGKHGERIAGLLEGKGVPTLLLDKYVEGTDPDLHLPGDFHWNAKGHQFVADKLAVFLREQWRE